MSSSLIGRDFLLAYFKGTFAVLLGCAMALGACAQTADARKFVQTISFHDNEVEFCALLANNGDQPLIITAPYSLLDGDQLTLLFKDQEGQLVSLKSSRVLRGAPSPSPYPSDRINYDIIWPNSSIQSCRTYPLKEISRTTAESFVEFKPWLKNSDEIPFNEAELRFRDGPIYKDEAIQTNNCRVNFQTKSAECDPV